MEKCVQLKSLQPIDILTFLTVYKSVLYIIQCLINLSVNGFNFIIALFNNGYKASDYVYGNWHGNRIKSTISRPGLQFMQAAV